MPEKQVKKWTAALLPVVAVGMLAAGGCEPSQKAETISDQGLVDPDGEYTEPSDTVIDRGVPGPEMRSLPAEGRTDRTV